LIEDSGLSVGDFLKEGFERLANRSGLGFQDAFGFRAKVYLDGHGKSYCFGLFMGS
jgi:hypothetical protein